MKRPASFLPIYRAFTLIELIIYSTLMTVIVGTFLSSMLYVTNAQNRDRERHAFVENERVLNQKLEWILYGASASQITPSSGTAVILQVQRSCSSILNFDMVASAVRVGKNSNGDCILDASDQHNAVTNSHVGVSNLQFTRLTINGQAAIRMQATLTGRFQSKDIDTTVYIK